MSAVRHKDTEPERLLRSALFRRQLRFRLQAKLPGRPDIIFNSAKVAIFVDGDFWHGGGWKQRGFARFEDQFSTNAAFWIQKIQGNVARDRRVNRDLRRMGWTVVRVWESQIRKSPERCAERIVRIINKRRD